MPVAKSPHPVPATVGQLRQSGYTPASVKDELRRNVIQKIRKGEELFPGVLGYRDSVIPQVINGILARHDLLFLGLRGQAKTRMLRMLPLLLDEWIPVLDGVEIPDEPLKPITTAGRRLVADQGDDAKIHWLHRSKRYHEKLATPDVTIADLIGEIDLVKYAAGRELSDEATMHFGLIPRSNRGIFAINELPDLAPRIQVGLFNVLEERDVQIRGYDVRLELDVCLTFSANPEDYTNRGRIVTPLKDRIGTVIRTHYPATRQEGITIAQSNGFVNRDTTGSASGVEVVVPDFLANVVEEVVRLARNSPHVSQASGVSVRTSIANLETVISSAERRGLLTGEKRVVARPSDLVHLVASCRGKIEMTLAEDDASEDKLIKSLTGEALKNIFATYMDFKEFDGIIDSFKGNVTFPGGDELSAAEFVANMKALKPIHTAAGKVAAELELNAANDGDLAAAGEFLLEALYVNDRLSKYSARGKTFFKR